MKKATSGIGLSAVRVIALLLGWTVWAAIEAHADTPALTTLSPSAATAGGAAFTLVVNGSGFDSTSVVQWNGETRPTTFVRSSQLRAAINSGDIAGVGSATVTVVNGGSGGTPSAGLSFTITSSVVPSISGLLPQTAQAGGTSFTLTVLGTGFVTGAVVQWNGTDRATNFFSSTTLEAAIGSADIATAGSVDITVRTPAPGSAVSNSFAFSIETTTGPPSITSLSPGSVVVGSAGFVLTVTGTNFSQTSVILWNGTARATTFVDDKTLKTSVSASELVSPANIGVTVLETAPGGATSNRVFFPIEPYATAYFPQLAVGGEYTTTITLTNNGSDLATGGLSLTDQAGNPLSVNIGEGAAAAPAGAEEDRVPVVASSIALSVPAGVTKIYGLTPVNAGDAARSGWARVQTSQGTLGGVATFRVRRNGALQTVAGVLSSSSVDAVTIPVDNDDAAQRYTGFAIANIGAENLRVRIVLINSNGLQVDSIDPADLNPLPPQQQVAKFLHQYIPSRSSFKGTLVLLPRAGARMAAVALITERGLLSVVPVLPGRPGTVEPSP